MPVVSVRPVMPVMSVMPVLPAMKTLSCWFMSLQMVHSTSTELCMEQHGDCRYLNAT